MKIVFDEFYGNLSFAQRAAYKKYNVSPSDHVELTDRFGDDAHDEITKAVKANVFQGMFSVFEFWRSQDGSLWV